jgi:RNA 2',3'-cyclic 3'-phosphodiesterase
MRLFTAIDVSAELTEALRSFVSRLRPAAQISWSPLENLHITTKFIGEWPEQRLHEMTRALASVPVHGSLEIAVKGLGWFPTPRRPRVFWAGVEGGEALRTLARATEETVAQLGVPVDKRDYAPHHSTAFIKRSNPSRRVAVSNSAPFRPRNSSCIFPPAAGTRNSRGSR